MRLRMKTLAVFHLQLISKSTTLRHRCRCAREHNRFLVVTEARGSSSGTQKKLEESKITVVSYGFTEEPYLRQLGIYTEIR
jgi:hypothetical protein